MIASASLLVKGLFAWVVRPVEASRYDHHVEVDQGAARSAVAFASADGDLSLANSGSNDSTPPGCPIQRGEKSDENHLFEGITGSKGHELPKNYGKVKEKTIWLFWHDPEHCASASKCTMPPHLELCFQSIKHNRGSFDVRLLHQDEVGSYVSWIELPIRWCELEPAVRKDSLMNALLARYGGVAMDLSTILLRPLDPYWEEMLSKRATFSGYMYRVTGSRWGPPEATAVWFLMARREGIFSTAVRNQVIGMGDRGDTGAYRNRYLALGDQTLTPILGMYNSSLPKCTDDPWVKEKERCPDYALPTVSGEDPIKNDTRILLREPREGPQLPFCFADSFNMGTWHISDASTKLDLSECSSPRDCWQRIFLRRYQLPAAGANRNGSGGPRPLHFVKMFHAGGRLASMSRKQLLADHGTFFYHWLQLAGLPLERMENETTASLSSAPRLRAHAQSCLAAYWFLALAASLYQPPRFCP